MTVSLGGVVSGSGALAANSYVAGAVNAVTVGTVAGTAYGYLEVQSGGVASGVQVQDGELQIDSGVWPAPRC